jgi:hypothetical protein
MKKPKSLTRQQQKSLHLFYRLLADELNLAGLDQRKVLKPSISIPWTPYAVKELLWRPIQMAMIGKESTTKLDKLGEIEKIHEVLMRELGLAFHVEFIPFPDKGFDYAEEARKMANKLEYPS